jgi:flagellar assembly protein FliH
MRVELRPLSLTPFEEGEAASPAVPDSGAALRAEYERGLQDGARAERERWTAEAARLREVLTSAAAALEARRAELLAGVEQDLVSLAVAIAGKIVRAEIEAGRPVAPAAVRRALELVGGRREVKILLNPGDVERVERCLPDLRRDLADLGRVTLEAADRVAPGGCVVVTAEGSVDAEVAVQLEEIERGLRG